MTLTSDMLHDSSLCATKIQNNQLRVALHDKETTLNSVSQNGAELQLASEKPQNDKEVVLKAVSQNGLELQSAKEFNKASPDMQKDFSSLFKMNENDEVRNLKDFKFSGKFYKGKNISSNCNVPALAKEETLKPDDLKVSSLQ